MVSGIDPSLTCTGVTVVDGQRIVTGRSRTATLHGNTAPREVRRRIRTSLARTLLLLPASGLFVIEGPSMASKFGQPHERAGLFWFLVDSLMARGEVVVVPPKRRAKLATGNGNAKKPAVLQAMRSNFPDVLVPDDNVADSLALAAAGSAFLGRPLMEYSRAQLDAFAGINWPVLTDATPMKGSK